MPIYEFQCDDCGHHGEELLKVGARSVRKCPRCGGKYRKQISAPAFQFKGSGWYVTDYARKDGGGGKSDDGQSGTAKSDSDGGSKTETKKASDKKSDSKGKSKKGSSTKD